MSAATPQPRWDAIPAEQAAQYALAGALEETSGQGVTYPAKFRAGHTAGARLHLVRWYRAHLPPCGDDRTGCVGGAAARSPAGAIATCRISM
uniref:Uncharacterized protein n=1 Tax=Spironucleus salmonicida TaxID=348837 RepID=V6LFU5_9EUKA|eukprot:EST43153.1 Hypothetical protein SS50377_17210 [Spironucleus salmonicida]